MHASRQQKAIGLPAVLLIGRRRIDSIDHQHLPARAKKVPHRPASAAAGFIGETYFMTREMPLQVTCQCLALRWHRHALMFTQIGAQMNLPALFVKPLQPAWLPVFVSKRLFQYKLFLCNIYMLFEQSMLYAASLNYPCLIMQNSSGHCGNLVPL